MAEGYFKYFSKKLSIDVNVLSAGVKAEGVNPKAVETMSNDNIDISNHTSNNINEYINEDISYVITVCDHAYENCPVWLKKSNIFHCNFSDPSKIKGDKKTIDIAYEKCRKEIKEFTHSFLKNNIQKQ
jgi:arsenate reductase